MLSHERLVELYRELREQRVLSVFINGADTDPAERKAWRTRTEHGLEEARRALSGAELEAFEGAARLLHRELDRFSAMVPDRGWVGYATSTAVVYADTAPAPMPDLVVWENGIRAAPYVRALKQARPVVVALADRRHARIFTYREGMIAESDDLVADQDLGDLSDGNQSRRGSNFSGSRGATAADEAHRHVEVNAERLHKSVVDRVVERAGPNGFVIVGGTVETGAHLLTLLQKGLRDRALEIQGLHMAMSDAEVRKHAEDGATRLTQSLQEGLATAVVDAGRAEGKGVLGAEGVAQALRERRVDTLLLSRTFLNAHPTRADHLVGGTFEQGGEVEELSGAGAELVDREAGGVAARLRW
jgi:hypothetical protein